MAASLALGVSMLSSGALAQAKKDKAPEKGAAAAPQKADPNQVYWVKVCPKVTAVGKNKEGKDEKKDINFCLTQHERIDSNTGMPIITAAVRQVEGEDKQFFAVMVPLGVLLPPGMISVVYTKEDWDKLQKNEKVDEAKIKPVRLAYGFCHSAGCEADMEITPEFLAQMKAGAALEIRAMTPNGPVGFAIPLQGFNSTYAGQPVDMQKFQEARRDLMQQIAQRQQQYLQEMKKQNEELQKMQGMDAIKGGKDAPAAKEKAAPKK
ncbi:MAG: invasion associated locus B family protein [Hyphomicrobiaceae bacterium]|nr:invasion associated locus B family protein [Hyphomicrobiaceae bacterium]